MHGRVRRAERGSTMVSLPALVFYGGVTLAVVFLLWVLFKLVQEEWR